MVTLLRAADSLLTRRETFISTVGASSVDDENDNALKNSKTLETEWGVPVHLDRDHDDAPKRSGGG